MNNYLLIDYKETYPAGVDILKMCEQLVGWKVTDTCMYGDVQGVADYDENMQRREVRLLLSGDTIPCDIAAFGFGADYRGSVLYVAECEEAVTDRFLELVWARFHGKPMEILTTKRLIVREMTEEDLPELYELYAYPGMTEFVEPLYEYEKELEFTKNYINNMYRFYGYGLWLVRRREDGKLIGRIGLGNRTIDGCNEVELGYMVGTPFWRHGYAYECCQAVIEYAFSEEGLDIDRLVLCTAADNTASAGLAHKLGFSLCCKSGWDEKMQLYYKLRKQY